MQTAVDTAINTTPARHTTLDDLWRPPAPSRGTRRPARRSRLAACSTVVGGTIPTEIHCESGMEKQCAYLLLAHPDVVDVWEQPRKISYVENGVLRHHTFDFLVTLRDGTKLALAVKPKEIADLHGLRDRLKLISEQAGRFADGYVLVTESQLDRDAVHNAILIHAVRRDDRPEDDVCMRRLVSDLIEPTSVADLVAQSGLDGYAFRAIVRLIDRGELIAVDKGRIDYPTRVLPARDLLTEAHQ